MLQKFFNLLLKIAIILTISLNFNEVFLNLISAEIKPGFIVNEITGKQYISPAYIAKI